MIYLDTNYILRFLLQDNEEMYRIAKDAIVNKRCYIGNEVLAEVVFVLQKVYQVSGQEIRDVLENLISFDNIILEDRKIALEALDIFDKKRLDFVDAILCARSNQYIVKTFDKKLQKCIENKQ